MRPLALISALGLLVAACGSDPRPPPTTTLRTGIASYDPDEARIADFLPMLVAQELALALNVFRHSDRDEIERIVRGVSAQGVPVAIIPDPSDPNRTVFANTTNWRAVADWTVELMDDFEGRGLPLWGFVIDMEPEPSRIHSLQETARAPNQLRAIEEWLLEKIEDPDYDTAHAGYRQLVQEGHARGFEMMVTTLPFVLDDLADGDPSLQRSLQSPITGIPWDQIIFQLYSTMYIDLIGEKTAEGPAGFVYEYAVTARERFGETAGAAVGLLPEPGWRGYGDPADLTADVRAWRAAGLPDERLHLYALEGLLLEDEPDRWFQWQLEPTPAPQADFILLLLRQVLADIDSEWP